MSGTFDLRQAQRDLLSILDEFFRRATGKSYSRFATPASFAAQVKGNADRLGSRGPSAYEWGGNALAEFYNGPGRELFAAARKIAGSKLVLGGTRFNPTQLDAVRRVLLYTDTVLIPDPVLPWIETERTEERFRHVLLLQNAFLLLHLRPLIDADLPYPAVVIFPSWEKSLETQDPTTQFGIETLWLAFLSNYTGQTFSDQHEVIEYLQSYEAEFMQSVERHRLFIPPGGTGAEPLLDAVRRYQVETDTWRTKEYTAKFNSLPVAAQVLNLIYERLVPTYHVLENADELNAHPMLSMHSHWHYYTLCTAMFEDRLAQHELLSPETVQTLQALNQPDLKWLGNVPISALVELRKNNENEEFRRQVDGYLRELHQSPLADLDRTAAAVSRGIAGMLAGHQRRIREIEEKYSLLHKKTAVGAWVTLAATLAPTLAPWIGQGLAPLAIASAYAWTKVEEAHEHRKAARSLMGVLATAAQRE